MLSILFWYIHVINQTQKRGGFPYVESRPQTNIFLNKNDFDVYFRLGKVK